MTGSHDAARHMMTSRSATRCCVDTQAIAVISGAGRAGEADRHRSAPVPIPPDRSDLFADDPTCRMSGRPQQCRALQRVVGDEGLNPGIGGSW